MKIIKENIDNDNNNELDPILEKLSEVAHDVWSSWVNNLLNKYLDVNGNIHIPIEKVNKWKSLVNTKYNDLSNEMKELDRIEARKYLEIININNK